jgi:ribosome biogenesis GTPase
MTSSHADLADLGWSSFFQAQCDLDDDAIPVRVMAVHRGALDVAGPGFATRIPAFAGDSEEDAATVGDWLLLDPAGSASRLLERKSLFKRKAAGAGRGIQLIAANVDTLFIVSACHVDFNPARLERYLALAREAEVTPVIVLTKADLVDDPNALARTAARLMPGLLVEIVDPRDRASTACLDGWCGHGQTVALVGSSGVGKSTLINTMTGATQATREVRDDDQSGRHTTTRRSLHRLPAGGWLLDTPGIRELQLTDVQGGVDDVFADVVALADQCRFADCRHESEPGCAIQAAIAAGRLEPDRLQRHRKLSAEDARNSASLAERQARDKAFGKVVKGVMRDKRRRQDL